MSKLKEMMSSVPTFEVTIDGEVFNERELYYLRTLVVKGKVTAPISCVVKTNDPVIDQYKLVILPDGKIKIDESEDVLNYLDDRSGLGFIYDCEIVIFRAR